MRTSPGLNLVAQNALFDSGTTLAGLPAAGLRPVVTALGATRSADVTRQAGGTGFAVRSGCFASK